MTKLAGVKAEFDEKGPTPRLSIAVNQFVLDWLRQHIAGSDMELGRFLTASNARDARGRAGSSGRPRTEPGLPGPRRRAQLLASTPAPGGRALVHRARMGCEKRFALIAHDSRKEDLLEWVAFNAPVLREHRLFATGTTGSLVEARCGLEVTRFKSGPLGGDQQVGAKIAEGEIDVLVFFWDPLESHPHDADVRALLRIAVLYDVPTACNRSTADFILASPLVHGEYERHPAVGPEPVARAG